MEFFVHSDYPFVKITFIDVALLIIYSVLILIFAYFYQKKKVESDPIYKFYTLGLFVKLLGGLIFAVIYMFVYEGDTLDYFNSAICLYNLMIKNFSQFWEIMVNGGNLQNFSYFDINTRWPEFHIWRDPHSFFVIRIIFPIIILGAKSFLLTTILLSWFSFWGIWKLYKIFCTFYPHLYKQFAIAFLFYPSVIFWGSGILKDTVTLSAIGWYCYGFYMVFVKRQKIFSNLIAIIISVWFIIAIKPYIFIALIPGTIIWLFFERLKKIANPLLKIIIMPFILGVSIFFGIGTIQLFGKNLDTYSSLDKMIAKAEVTQSDLKNAEQYGYNYYDLGEIDFTVKGILKKSPQAIIAGLFRPFIWEVRSVFAILAGLENFVLLFFVIFLILRLGFFSFFRTFFSSPLLTFSFFFAILFAFSIGISNANFGALVRYKIPLLPFFLASLFIMLNEYKVKKSEDLS